MFQKKVKVFILALSLSVYFIPTQGKLILPSIFQSNMVLQQESKVKLWGWGKTKERVEVYTSWDETIHKTEVDADGHFTIELKTPVFGGPFQIKIKGNNEIILEDILIGEVWFASGQSNMEWSADMKIDHAEKEINEAYYPEIRLFSSDQLSSNYPQETTSGKWEKCSSESMKKFSAVAYFFGKELYNSLHVPIGLIHSSWGGTPAEAWVPESYINNDKILFEACSSRKPSEWGPSAPGKLYNGMIHPYINFKIKGVLWYQGESNVGTAYQYDRLLSTLIHSWRQKWNYEFPFYFVQIAPFKNTVSDQNVILRNAQRRVEQKIANTGMVVISDIGDLEDIHPKNKQDVGKRLAKMALFKDYQVGSEMPQGPKLLSYESTGNKLKLFFDSPVLQCDENCQNSFEIANISGEFKNAKIRIISNVIELSNKEIQFPIFGRFAWDNKNINTIKGKNNLPSSAFVTDNFLQFIGY
jgi:sialate O-acetylesterase